MFPIFFGVMVGDVGYGLLMLALCVGLWKFMKGDEVHQFLKILRNASIMSIFFGLLFSEFLGFELPWAPIIYSRHLNIGVTEAGGHGAAIAELLIVSVWVGILYVTLGRALGMINHARQDHGDHRIKAVLANLGWITVMWGILIAIWSMFPIPLMPDLTGLPIVAVGLSVGMVLAIVFIVMGVIFIARDAVLEIIEIPTIISHVLCTPV